MIKPAFLSSLQKLTTGTDDFEELVSRLEFGVFVDQVEQGCIYANDESLRMFDMDWRAFQGFGWANVVHPEDVELLRDAIQRYEVEKTWVDVQYRILASDGSVRVIHVLGKAILDSSGEHKGSVMIGREVTAERAIMDRTIELQKLEAIGRLAGRVAHDFNNVLTPILGSACLLEEEQLTPDGTLHLETIERSVEHASAITKQLLGLSNHSAAEIRTNALDPELRKLTTMLRQLLGEGIDLRISLSALQAEVNLASHEIGQIALNLASNSRDAMNGNGVLFIETSLQEGFVTLVVRDEGCGISDDIKDEIFTPFFTTKSPDRGTGLGLSSVAELVKRIGGKIEFESEPGLGTSMTVSLPRVDDPFPHAVKEAAKLAELPPLKVLIVDDNDALRQTLAYVFALRGHTVKTSAGIERAMELLQSSPFDVLVTDILLADGTGDELVEQARSKYPTLNVVYMSGFTEDSTETLQLDNLHTSFIPKPFHPNQLISVIAEQVDSAV